MDALAVPLAHAKPNPPCASDKKKVISREQFYEGAALHALIRAGANSIVYDRPFYLVNESISIYLKFSTAKRTPWAFTIADSEHAMLAGQLTTIDRYVGFICGDDGIAAVSVVELLKIVPRRSQGARLSCARLHGECYAVSGPEGTLSRKVRLSAWNTLISRGDHL